MLNSLLVSSHISPSREGRSGTTGDFTTSFLHFSLFSTALWDLANSRPVHTLMLSSHLFLCLPCLLPPFTVPCKMVLARPDERKTWPYHCSLRLFTIVRRSSCGPIACWISASHERYIREKHTELTTTTTTTTNTWYHVALHHGRTHRINNNNKYLIRCARLSTMNVLPGRNT